MEDLFVFVGQASKVGMFGLLLIFVVGLKMEWWFMGGEVKRERARADKMETMLFQALNIGERSTRVAESKVYEFDSHAHRDGIIEGKTADAET